MEGGLYELKNIKLNNQVSMKYLQYMSILGLDIAYLAMLNRTSGQSNKNYIAFAKAARKRFSEYDNIDNKKKISSEAVKTLKTISSNFANIPFKSIINPIGKGQFLKLKESISSGISIKDVIDYIHQEGPGELDIKFKDISNFKAQAIASIVFHNYYYLNFNFLQLEADNLDYIFAPDYNLEDIEYFIKQHTPINISQFFFLNELSEYPHPIYNITEDIISILGMWKNSSFSAILSDVSTLPRYLKLSNKLIDISEPDYPEDIKKMSIFTLSTYTASSNIKDKIKQLYNLDLHKIGDLIILTEKYRFFFTKKYSTRILKEYQAYFNPNNNIREN